MSVSAATHPSQDAQSGGSRKPGFPNLPLDFILCAAMPDEPAQAHAIRMARFNGFTSVGALAAVLSGPGEADSEMAYQRLLRLLAFASSQSVDDYCQQHSMYPCRHIVSNLSDQDFLKEQRENFLSTIDEVHERPRICALCTAADLAQHGFSWYRRRHAIPGIDCCVVHGSALRVVDAPNRYISLPHESLAELSATAIHPGNQNFANAPDFVKKYAEAYLTLANLRSPISKDSVAIVISHRTAQLMGGASSKRLTKMVLLQMVASKAPEVWLRGMSQGKDVGNGLAALQNNREVANEYLALAITGLFPSPESAIREFRRTQAAPEFSLLRGLQGAELRRLMRDPAWPVYWRNATWLGYHASAISSRTAEGIQWDVISKLPDLETSGTWRALKMFCDGSSIREACSLHSANTTEIERLVRPEMRIFCDFVEKLQSLTSHEETRAWRGGPEARRRRCPQPRLSTSSGRPDNQPLEGTVEELGRALANKEIWLSSLQLGQLLFPEVGKPKKEVQRIRREGIVLGVFDGLHVLYPKFQIVEGGRLHPKIATLMKSLPLKRDASVATHVARWLFTRNPRLKSKTPAEMFVLDADRIIELAKSAASEGSLKT